MLACDLISFSRASGKYRALKAARDVMMSVKAIILVLALKAVRGIGE